MNINGYCYNDYYVFQAKVPLHINGCYYHLLCSVCEQRVRGASEISKFLRDTTVSVVIF